MEPDPAASRPARKPSLWTPGFRLLLVATLFGWSAEGIVSTVLPLRILDLGGDAAAVGLVAAVFAIPTLLLRPAIGKAIDRRGHGTLHKAGVLIATIAPLGYLLGSIALIPVNRLVQGVGWALYGTSNNVATARLAPPSRRGEASGYFNFTYALGFLVGPPLALFLYQNAQPGVPFLAASALAGCGLVAVVRLARVTPGAVIRHDPVATAAAEDQARRLPALTRARRAIAGYLEPTAIPPLLVTALFMAGQGLFLGFAPVYAREIGAPLAQLALLYPVFGILNALSQLGSGPLSDRIGRALSVVAGASLATVGLAVAAGPFGFGAYLVGAACFAVGAGIVVPAVAAAAMDLAPEGRLGAQMATFSMSYQLASGAGGLAWGLLIAEVGYPVPFLVAIVLQVGSVALAVRYLPRGHRFHATDVPPDPERPG